MSNFLKSFPLPEYAASSGSSLTNKEHSDADTVSPQCFAVFQIAFSRLLIEDCEIPIWVLNTLNSESAMAGKMVSLITHAFLVVWHFCFLALSSQTTLQAALLLPCGGWGGRVHLFTQRTSMTWPIQHPWSPLWTRRVLLSFAEWVISAVTIPLPNSSLMDLLQSA